ncbi:MAG: 4-hydroxyphenylpyruvate dioxygenase [Chloroflexi bacterium]|nr:4-hydroxyphenylpyruvate dioxygenase [Chloroflexota bacterium]
MNAQPTDQSAGVRAAEKAAGEQPVLRRRDVPGAPEDALPLRGIAYIELYVGNARQAAHFYRTAFGFDVVAYAGPETGVRDRASYVLRQGGVRLILTAGLGPASPIAEHARIHGDGVHDVAFLVDDAAVAYAVTTGRGAKGIKPPTVERNADGLVVRATVAAYGDTVHTFVANDGYRGAFLPGYRARLIPGPRVGLHQIDHVVANVELGKMNEWVDYYARIFGFGQLVHFDDKDISTEYSALMSKVMQDGDGRIKLPINEPATGRKKSQIQEYLDYYQGPGVQHIALLTDDIVATVRALGTHGVEFLRTPGAYYDALPGRIGTIDENLAELRELGVLADRDDEGYLLQIFTRPVQDRPTLFFEVIQRKGSRGFGKGNFKALFEAIEQEQARRGNL